VSIVGSHPESGVRIDVERAPGAAPPYRYAGEAVTPTERFGLEAEVDASGAVVVTLQAGAPASLAERARLLLRAAVKHAKDEDTDPPRRIVRWRPDG